MYYSKPPIRACVRWKGSVCAWRVYASTKSATKTTLFLHKWSSPVVFLIRQNLSTVIASWHLKSALLVSSDRWEVYRQFILIAQVQADLDGQLLSLALDDLVVQQHVVIGRERGVRPTESEQEVVPNPRKGSTERKGDEMMRVVRDLAIDEERKE